MCRQVTLDLNSPTLILTFLSSDTKRKCQEEEEEDEDDLVG